MSKIKISVSMCVGCSPGLANESRPAATMVRELNAVRQVPVGASIVEAPSHTDRSCASLRTSSAEERLAALLTGVATRRHVRVTTVAPGLVLVRIAGDEGCFRRVGLEAAFTGHDDTTQQRLAYVASATGRHYGTVLAADAGLRSVTSFANEAFGASSQRAGALINGAFFNFQRRADTERAEHTPIGALCAAGRVHDGLPIPAAYAGDYVRLSLGDGSYIESAPLLTVSGAPVFFAPRCNEEGYRLPDGFSFKAGCIRPGELLHAADPNPRAGISVPVTPEDDVVRLAVGLANGRGAARSGYSMASWSGVMSRLDKLGGAPHVSINLDGGNSIALVASDGRGGRVHIGQAQACRKIGSAIAFIGSDS